MNNGWIALHRKLKDSPIYKDSQAVHLWIHLLLSVNHKPGQAIIGNQVIKVQPGQMVTGRKSMSYATGVSRSKLERLLKLFEKLGKIEQQTFNKYRIISILNWKEYQESEQQMSNTRATDEQQMSTNNNVNNVNNVNKKQRRKKPPDTKINYPKELNQKAWLEYLTYRREAKIRKLTTKGEVKQIEKVISYGSHDIQQQCIDQTIANGWQGIFPLKQNRTGHQSTSDRFLQNVRDNWSDE